MQLDGRGESLYLYSNNEVVSWYTLYKCFSIQFNSAINIPKLQLWGGGILSFSPVTSGMRIII